MSWGIMANWKDSGCYFTNQIEYIQNEQRQFLELYERGLIFRDFKPVFWSPESRTALAESELKYNESHCSKAVTVRLHVKILPVNLKELVNRKVYALTWTTTPWTLLANQALAFSTDFRYCFAEDANNNVYIMAVDLLKNIEGKIGPLNIISIIKGDELSKCKYEHPITKEIMPFLPADHVTNTIGTGLVHTAPAHGTEDFIIALENKIPILSVVDDDGKYTEETGKFSGLFVLNKGNQKVMEHLSADILHTEDFVHSYPYDWRTKKPVIIRATHQWFIDINCVKKNALKAISNIQIYPQNNAEEMLTMLERQVEKRPYWCISRQRSWGTPIPVFYHKHFKKIFVNRKSIERYGKLMEKYGPDCWWELSTKKLLGRAICEENNLNCDELEKGNDIMDVWFDSGVSWSSVVPEGQADLYLEGLDQFNGWFQSSLLTSIALQGTSPYRSLFVHGFTVDENLKKMSKSEGNVVNPVDITNGGEDLKKNPAYGVDTLRWWVASHGSQHHLIPVSANIIKESSESVNKLRLILRFLLGVLNPYIEKMTTEPDYHYLDKYMLHNLYKYNKTIQGFYNNYQYHHVCKAVINFVVNDVSSNYCHLIKDRLYCDEINSPYRVGAVEVAGEILTVLARTIAPILPHLAEEVWLHHPLNLASVSLHRIDYKVPEIWNQPDLEKLMVIAYDLKSQMNKLLKQNSWELAATITVPQKDYNQLSVLQKENSSSTSELCEILQLSCVTLLEGDNERRINFEPIKSNLCKRCRRHPVPANDELCERCMKVLDLKKSTFTLP
ncbi:isoleucine--tRNA ligase, mitochondrial isoform X2 [Prorops nasuta]